MGRGAGSVVPPSPVDADHLGTDQGEGLLGGPGSLRLHGDLFPYGTLRQTRSGRHLTSQSCPGGAREAVWS
jgi:hypothetical protein